MRRLIAALALVVAGCAQPGFPPGGPEEKVPPKLLAVKPDSGAVNVRADEVSLQFDEVLNEQSGGTDLNKQVVISPRAGEPRVGWHRSRLTVRGSKDWKPNTAYTITIFPGLADLRGNVRKEPVVTVFSTGATIPSGSIAGIVFDWVAGTPLTNAWAEAISVADTNTVYLARSDSAGRFAIAHVPSGAYTVRAFGDANNDRVLDQREPWDTAGVILRDSTRVELLAFIHDTIGPRVQQVSTLDSLTLRVRFDKPLDPAMRLDTSLFTVRKADSTVVPIRLAESAIVWDSTHAGAGTRTDSARAADSLRVADSLRTARAVRPAPGAARADTTKRAPAPKPSRASPTSEVVIAVGAPLQPGASYRVEWRGVKNLLGSAATGSFTFTVPKAGEAQAPGAAREAPPAGAAPSRPPAKPRQPPDTSGTRKPPTGQPTKQPVPPDTSRSTTEP